MAGERLEKCLNMYRERYRGCGRLERGVMLDEFCRATGYHRKYAVLLLNRVEQGPANKTAGRRRRPTYSPAALRVVEKIWKAAGYPWSQRLKALLPQWLPWARKYVPGLTPAIEAEVLAISPRQIDRRLRKKKQALKRGIYGRTKPGTLLKRQIPVSTEHWDVAEPGFTELDLVSHSGESASGEFIHSLNVTDIQSAWVETRAIMGKGETGVVQALEAVRQDLPFALRGIDSDNGSEFINHHLFRYCGERRIQFTRGRPYHKNDNAHIEQKNWTHVRKVFGWARYDNVSVLDAMNDLYANELSLMMNLFQPSVKLLKKERRGSRVRRIHGAPKTPLDRLAEHCLNEGKPVPQAVRRLLKLRESIDPFELADAIDAKLTHIETLRKAGKKISVLDQRTGSPRGARASTTNPKEAAHDA